MIRHYRSLLLQSPVKTRALAVWFISFTILLLSGRGISAEDLTDKIPHVSEKAQEGFIQYQHSGKNKAYAIAPGGAWYWQSDAVSEEQAGQQAIKSCQKHTQQKCVLYALNDRIVFDQKRWPTLWGPYLDKNAASQASTGIGLGQLFPDLQWLDKQGNKTSIADNRGKVIFLHFWGSWCPPCMREFPSLKSFQMETQGLTGDMIMVALQLRESFSESMQWARDNGFESLPLYDSGVEDNESTSLKLADGKIIPDRTIARVFPSTYVLDKNGIVIFSHNGPVDDWLEYTSFFKHAVMMPGAATR